jgi:outer membrane protein OmpA-like peptidoglycan-associated protein
MFGVAMAFAPGLALGQAEPLKGLIISRTDTTIVVRGSAGDTPVAITGSTKIRGTSGALGIRGEDHPPSDLIKGLPVEIVTTQEGPTLTAAEITFKNSDLKTAQQIGAGIASTEKQVSENAERIDNVGLLTAAGRTKVLFPVGSATISEQGKQDLQGIATQAKQIKGAYRLAVVGRADPSGNAAANRRLSAARAAAVKDYLIQSAGISPANFIPDTALGSAPVAQDPDPPKNAADARRVTVTIAVSKSARVD